MEGMTFLQSPQFEKFSHRLFFATTLLLVLGGIIYFISYFYTLTALLGLVLIITYILIGPVNLMESGITKLSAWMSRWRPFHAITRVSPDANPRILAVAVVYFAFFMGLTLGAIQLLPILSDQINSLGRTAGSQIGDLADNAMEWVDTQVGQGTVKKIFAEDIQAAQKQGLVQPSSAPGKSVTEEEKHVIQESVIKKTAFQLEGAIASALPNFIGFVTRTVRGFVYLLAGLLLTFYFLVDGHKLREGFLNLLPIETQTTASSLLGSFHNVMFSFVKGQVMLGVLTGCYMFIVYSIFGVPYAFLLGVFFAVAELLPVIGTWLGIGAGFIIILLNMEPITLLWVFLCSYGYQTIKDNILAPKVVGDVMGLHPLVIIFSLLICAKVAGLLGILMALPLASVLNVLLRFFLHKDAIDKGSAPV